MNDFFKNVDTDTLRKAKNTIDQMLTEEQKQKLMRKVGNISKEELLAKMNQLAGNRDLEMMLKNLDQATLSEKLKDLK